MPGDGWQNEGGWFRVWVLGFGFRGSLGGVFSSKCGDSECIQITAYSTEVSLLMGTSILKGLFVFGGLLGQVISKRYVPETRSHQPPKLLIGCVGFMAWWLWCI